MKRLNMLNLVRYFAMMMVVMAVAFVGCEDEVDSPIDPNINTADSSSVVDDAEIEALFDDIENVGIEAIGAADPSSGGRYDNIEFMGCAIITANLLERTLTIDFGEGCEGPRGRLRSGKIIISYTGARDAIGSVVTTTFENFFIDGRRIDGTRTVTNISEEGSDILKFRVTITGGKVTWPDGTFATREVDRTKSWVPTDNQEDDRVEFEGTASGTTRRSVSYSVKINSALIIRRVCVEENNIYVPVQGEKLITRSGRGDITVDYGNGTCDRAITIRKGDRSIDIELTRD
ncbi:hypothetical protein QQ008_17025 [Fulvivirgaceae bacterium BMA10]|uniref:Lipoprotein n=1 Tax=Splendidivirga corallicola TaxID=3051826 RepID=A0ABT8KQR1_9BACT|nr:hypothetical protein [Fulvivirgaceae bacterium BMA10]